MRKRIVIGFVIAVGIGTIAYFVSQPKKGSVEWHKRKYLAAWYGDSTMYRLHTLWCRITNDKWRIASYRYRSEGMRLHRTALIRLGYLTQRMFVVSNRAANEVLSNAWFVLPHVNQEFICFNTTRSTNVIELSTLSDDMPKWAESIRKADVPVTGK